MLKPFCMLGASTGSGGRLMLGCLELLGLVPVLPDVVAVCGAIVGGSGIVGGGARGDWGGGVMMRAAFASWRSL